MLVFIFFYYFSACGQNTDNNKKDSDQTQERDKKSNETEKQSNDEVAENNQNTKHQLQGESNAAETTNEANNQISQPITIGDKIYCF